MKEPNGTPFRGLRKWPRRRRTGGFEKEPNGTPFRGLREWPGRRRTGGFTKEPNGFALRKGDVDTLNFFDSWIRVVESEGWLKEIRRYWFETRDWESRIQ